MPSAVRRTRSRAVAWFRRNLSASSPKPLTLKKTMSTSGSASKTANPRARASGVSRSSSSRWKMKSPVAACSPLSLDVACPNGEALRSKITSRFATARKAATSTGGVEPSSMTMSSHSGYVWSDRLSTASRSSSGLQQDGMMTLTRFISIREGESTSRDEIATHKCIGRDGREQRTDRLMSAHRMRLMTIAYSRPV